MGAELYLILYPVKALSKHRRIGEFQHENLSSLPVDGAAVCGEVGELVEDGPLPDDGVRQARVPIELQQTQPYSKRIKEDCWTCRLSTNLKG